MPNSLCVVHYDSLRSRETWLIEGISETECCGGDSDRVHYQAPPPPTQALRLGLGSSPPFVPYLDANLHHDLTYCIYFQILNLIFFSSERLLRKGPAANDTSGCIYRPDGTVDAVPTLLCSVCLQRAKQRLSLMAFAAELKGIFAEPWASYTRFCDS